MKAPQATKEWTEDSVAADRIRATALSYEAITPKVGAAYANGDLTLDQVVEDALYRGIRWTIPRSSHLSATRESDA